MTNFGIYSAPDIMASMSANLILPSITIWLCFFLFLIVFKNPFYKSCSDWKCKTTGAPIAVANDAIEMLPVTTDKTIND